MKEVVLPRIDPVMQSGKVIQWLRNEGDLISKGEPLVVVEGEKTTFEIEAPHEGTLKKILRSAGEEVQVGQALAVISEPGETVGEHVATTRNEIAEKLPQMSQLSKARREEVAVRASPAARRLAEEMGVDLSHITGTGPEGRITREDILAYVEYVREQPKGLESRTTPKIRARQKLEGIRKAVAEKLSLSFRSSVPVTLTTRFDAERLLYVREQLSKSLEREITLTSLIIRAVAKCLEEYPEINSSLDGDQLTLYDDINIAFAVDTPKGLVAPVVHNANRMSVAELSERVLQLVERARAGTLTIGDLTGYTFTITSLGELGVEVFTPVINPPSSGILGIGKISQQPVVIDGAVQVRNIGFLSLVFDHRVIDGTPAARFLNRVTELLERIEP